jgi:tetrapyrrole methylase family protein/MazG family protein
VPKVVVAGLGPAGAELLTAATLDAIAATPRRRLRTARHPSAGAVRDAASFDHLYESAASLDEVYAGIVDALTAEARACGEVLYLVPGSPLVAERTVELLRADPRVDAEILPALSFLDLAWDRLGVDPLSGGVRLVDGQRFAVEAAGERGPLLVAQCDSQAVLSEVKLAVDDPPPSVTVLHHLGGEDESVTTVAWADLDRVVAPDHLTSLWIPALAAPVAAELVRFLELVRTLRARCPWDREQTHRTLTRHLLEETYEVLEAIEALEPEPTPAQLEHLEEELGDLLFQVVFHATLAAEEGAFTLADVARTVHDKLVGRHPHVFGTAEAETADHVMRNWEQAKLAEKGRTSLMEGIAGDLPSLLYAHKVQRKAAGVGLDPVEGIDLADSLRRVTAAGQRAGDQEVGLLLFAVVALGRQAGVDPEAALRGVTGSYRRRFEALERLAAGRGLDLGPMAPADLAELWRSLP